MKQSGLSFLRLASKRRFRAPAETGIDGAAARVRTFRERKTRSRPAETHWATVRRPINAFVVYVYISSCPFCNGEHSKAIDRFSAVDSRQVFPAFHANLARTKFLEISARPRFVTTHRSTKVYESLKASNSGRLATFTARRP